jgi:hypothetical protein
MLTSRRLITGTLRRVHRRYQRRSDRQSGRPAAATRPLSMSSSPRSSRSSSCCGLARSRLRRCGALTELATTAVASLVGDENVKSDPLPRISPVFWSISRERIFGSAMAARRAEECCAARITTSTTRSCRRAQAIESGLYRYCPRIMPQSDSPDLPHRCPAAQGRHFHLNGRDRWLGERFRRPPRKTASSE